MPRLTDTLMEGAYSRESRSPMTNLARGGMHGWAPNLAEFHANQAFVTRPLIPIVLEAPRLFTLFPGPEKWIASFKSMIELHSRQITGLKAGITNSFESHPVGGGGEEQEEIVDSKRERSTPTHQYVEKVGRPIQILHEYWSRYAGMDPETKVALAATLAGEEVTDLLADFTTATIMYIRPDVMHKNVDYAWICANMFPKSTGTIEGKRDLTSGQELLIHDIEYTSIAQVGNGVNAFAQQILDEINMTNADPFFRPAFVDSVAPDVEAAERGYKSWLEEVGRTAVSNMS